MAMQFTPSQTDAIETQGKNILVSASAGSGKTRVLVERVVRQVLAGAEIDRYLIVTFTEAAAAEMKERLENAIIAQLEQVDATQQQHLRRQLRLLKVANISTLHAFAKRLIEQYHYAIDLDPQFRLADDAESMLLKLEVFQALLEQAYKDDESGDFKDFVQQFMTGNQEDQPLQNTVLNLFEFAMARPDTDEWLASLPAAYQYEGDFCSSPIYQNQIKPFVLSVLDGLIMRNERLHDDAEVDHDETYPGIANRKFNLETDGASFTNARTLVANQEDWQTVVTGIQGITFDKWGSKDGKGKNIKKDADPELKAHWDKNNEQRKDLIAEFSKLRDNFFRLDAEGVSFASQGAAKTLQQLVQFVQKFRTAFLEAKLQRKMLDFNDLEHFALAIVQQPEIAEELREHYQTIMVDEYQDTNQLQEAILQAFARPDNVFQVGDIKQSIYKFRQADPYLFQSKLQDYPASEHSTVITLQENFRSHPNVTNFINYLFTQFMSTDLGDVDYRGTQELVAGAKYYQDNLTQHAELLTFISNQPDDEDGESEVEPALAPEDGYNAATGQITLMAQRIQEMMQEQMVIYDRDAQVKRPLRYSDITILVPSRAQNLDVLAIFRKYEIPITIAGTENFFQTIEISIVMALLQIIDNPHQDIPLVAVLRSPIYNLGENALTFIRAQQQTGDFFDAVRTTAKEGQVLTATDEIDVDIVNDTQAALQRFLADLDHFRSLAVQNRIVDLLWLIYDTTAWLDYVGGLPAGAQRQANLHALYEYAADYQRSSFVGLYQFINYIDQIRKQDKDLGEADANLAPEAVQLMTIHHSKGLEFPVVFVLNASRQMISPETLQGNLLLDAYAGAGIDYIDTAHYLQLPTPQRNVVTESIRRGAFAEQLRVLYVALTRAEQHLFLVGAYQSVDTMTKKWDLAAFGSERILPDWVRLQAKSYMDLAGMSLLRHPKIAEKLQKAGQAMAGYDKPQVSPQPSKEVFNFDLRIATADDLDQWESTHQLRAETKSDTVAKGPNREVPVAEWQQTLQFDYPYAAATRTTNYQSVSELKRLYEDPDLAEGRNGMDRRLVGDDLTGLRFKTTELPGPAFMQTKDNKVSPAAVGTATHAVMQKAELTNGAPTHEQLQMVVDQLVSDGIIEAPVAEHIRLDQIEQFFTEVELGKMIVANAVTVQREVPFSLLMTADRLYQEFDNDHDERVLIHGIMDGYVQVGDETWLFDYKTDFVGPNEDASTVLTKRYAGQLRVYAQSLAAMGKANIRSFIYSFAKHEVIEIK